MSNQEITVVKVGTGVLTRTSDGTLDGAALVRLVTALAALVDGGTRTVLVSSGAVGAGVAAFQLDGYPSDLVTRQACAAVGQSRLMAAYEGLFRNFEVVVAQLLLTGDDLRTPGRRGRVLDTLRRLLDEPRVLPIINENDSVAVEELKVGDNDMLSMRVAELLGARRLVLLTSVDGLLDPRTGHLIEDVASIDEVTGLALEEKGRLSIGGMKTKLEAVRCALAAGIETFIANGRKPERLPAIVKGTGKATRFAP
jgi:glutamate 5-kinase